MPCLVIPGGGLDRADPTGAQKAWTDVAQPQPSNTGIWLVFCYSMSPVAMLNKWLWNSHCTQLHNTMGIDYWLHKEISIVQLIMLRLFLLVLLMLLFNREYKCNNLVDDPSYWWQIFPMAKINVSDFCRTIPKASGDKSCRVCFDG